jgi:hypothetical protein
MHFDAKKDYKVVNAMPSPPLSADMKPLDGLVVSIPQSAVKTRPPPLLSNRKIFVQ